MWQVGNHLGQRGQSGHLGDRVSALLDGQLSEAESERAWAHVGECQSCNEVVERENWIKNRLAGLTYDPTGASDGLKGSLLGAGSCEPGTFLAPDHHRRHATLAAIGGGAVGAAVMGVLALGAAPASAPTITPPAVSGAGVGVVITPSPSASAVGPIIDLRRP